jgi:hypothetical protein
MVILELAANPEPDMVTILPTTPDVDESIIEGELANAELEENKKTTKIIIPIKFHNNDFLFITIFFSLESVNHIFMEIKL